MQNAMRVGDMLPRKFIKSVMILKVKYQRTEVNILLMNIWICESSVKNEL